MPIIDQSLEPGEQAAAQGAEEEKQMTNKRSICCTPFGMGQIKPGEL